MDGVNPGFAFCGNSRCPLGLHVRAGDRNVNGDGNWARLADGIMMGRGVYQGVYLCDACGKALLQGVVKLAIVPPLFPPADVIP
jgi:hypothetical protein